MSARAGQPARDHRFGWQKLADGIADAISAALRFLGHLLRAAWHLWHGE